MALLALLVTEGTQILIPPLMVSDLSSVGFPIRDERGKEEGWSRNLKLHFWMQVLKGYSSGALSAVLLAVSNVPRIELLVASNALGYVPRPASVAICIMSHISPGVSSATYLHHITCLAPPVVVFYFLKEHFQTFMTFYDLGERTCSDKNSIVK